MAHRFFQSPAYDASEYGLTGYDNAPLAGGPWDDPEWNAYGTAIGGLEAADIHYALPDRDVNRFVPEAGSVAENLLRGNLSENYGLKGEGQLPPADMYDFSSRPAEIVASIEAHPSMHSSHPAPTLSRGPRFSPAYPSDIALPAVMPIPLPEAGPFERTEGASATIDDAQLRIPRGDSKRPRAEEEDRADEIRPSKKPKAPRVQSRKTPLRRAATKEDLASEALASTRAAPPVAGPSNLHSAAVRTDAEPVDESDSDSDADKNDNPHDGTRATGNRTKRSRRTKVQVAALTRTDLPKVSCPVQGCATMFNPLTHDANRGHLKLHYPEGALDKSASLPCLWAGCMMQEGKGKPWKPTRKPGTTMITHLHQAHVGRAYTCPVPECTKWASSRSGDLPQHLARNHKGWRPP